jgi:membrane protein
MQAAVTREVTSQLTDLLGNTGAGAVETLLAGASRKQQGLLATVLGTIVLVFTAVGMVVQLKETLSGMCSSGPEALMELRAQLRDLIGCCDFSGLFTVGFSRHNGATRRRRKLLGSQMPTTVLQALNFVISFRFITLLFAMMFKWLPDAKVCWRDVWLGGVVTAALFDLGKFVIGFYLGRLGLESSYAGAASVLVLLLWVYYSAQIVLLGAEFTHVYSNRRPIRA